MFFVFFGFFFLERPGPNMTLFWVVFSHKVHQKPLIFNKNDEKLQTIDKKWLLHIIFQEKAENEK